MTDLDEELLDSSNTTQKFWIEASTIKDLGK